VVFEPALAPITQHYFPPSSRPTPTPHPKGASTSEVTQKLYSSAARGAVTDDPLGYGTLFPAANRDLADLSASPNRLLQSRLVEQAVLLPGALRVAPGDEGTKSIEVRLAARPAAAVTIRASVTAAWDGAALAEVAPTSLTVAPERWNETGATVFAVRPRGVSEGTYFVQFDFT
jgi:hypothetical protein